MDANHGSVFETIGFTDLVLFDIGMAFYYLSQKQVTAAYNTAESELYAATTGGNTVKWTHVWLEDFRVPIMEPIPMGEDNEDTRIIVACWITNLRAQHIHTILLLATTRRSIRRGTRTVCTPLRGV
jgi:hypothetical protein